MENNCTINAAVAEKYVKEQGFIYNSAVELMKEYLEQNNASSWDEQKAISELLWGVKGLMRHSSPRDTATLAAAVMNQVAPYVFVTKKGNQFRYYFELIYNRFWQDVEDGLI